MTNKEIDKYIQEMVKRHGIVLKDICTSHCWIIASKFIETFGELDDLKELLLKQLIDTYIEGFSMGSVCTIANIRGQLY